jgi:hypothetical protein
MESLVTWTFILAAAAAAKQAKPTAKPPETSAKHTVVPLAKQMAAPAAEACSLSHGQAVESSWSALVASHFGQGSRKASATSSQAWQKACRFAVRTQWLTLKSSLMVLEGNRVGPRRGGMGMRRGGAAPRRHFLCLKSSLMALKGNRAGPRRGGMEEHNYTSWFAHKCFCFG